MEYNIIREIGGDQFMGFLSVILRIIFVIYIYDFPKLKIHGVAVYENEC